MQLIQGLFPIQSLKKKLILYNLCIVTSIAIFISIFNYSSYRRNTIESTVALSMSRTKNISNQLDVAYEEMINIVLNCAQRNSIFLSLKYQDLASPSGKRLALYGVQILNDYCAISGYNQYIAKLTLFSENSIYFQSGYIRGSTDDAQIISVAPWFQNETNKLIASYPLSLVPSPFRESRETHILPLVYPLEYNPLNPLSSPNGWIFLGISPKLYTNTLSTYSDGNPLFAITADGDVIASIKQTDMDVTSLIPYIQKQDDLYNNLKVKINGETCYVSYHKQEKSDIIIFEIINASYFNKDHKVTFQLILILFFFCIIIGLFLAILLSNNISKPISRLVKVINGISQGNFSHTLNIEGDDEIGEIGKCVNNMSKQIEQLLYDRVQTEKEKKNLEINMLQAQINPHFLYNTLDSIRWIAIIQKNSGIITMVTALSNLLKNMAKGFNEKVTLRQEMDFLNDYIIIEKVRYVELFDVTINIKDSKLYDATIVKLTLQPLVENAIFNGIESCNHNGTIHITAESHEHTLYITVEDNGIGIPPEKVKDLLTQTKPVKGSTMSGIGLPNVDRRLKLVYGEKYGLEIESEVDKYTRITVKLPLEF